MEDKSIKVTAVILTGKEVTTIYCLAVVGAVYTIGHLCSKAYRLGKRAARKKSKENE